MFWGNFTNFLISTTQGDEFFPFHHRRKVSENSPEHTPDKAQGHGHVSPPSLTVNVTFPPPTERELSVLPTLQNHRKISANNQPKKTSNISNPRHNGIPLYRGLFCAVFGFFLLFNSCCFLFLGIKQHNSVQIQLLCICIHICIVYTFPSKTSCKVILSKYSPIIFSAFFHIGKVLHLSARLQGSAEHSRQATGARDSSVMCNISPTEQQSGVLLSL